MGKTSKMTAGNWMVPVSANGPQGPMPSPPIQMTGGLDPISATIATLNTNPYLIGIFMLLLNLGGRFLSLELTKKQEAFLQSPWIRPVIFFVVIFIATRNLVAAFWVTLLFFFVIWVVANENSPFCMIPSWSDADNKESEIYQRNVAKLEGIDI
jgi:hypothetical protein